MMSQKLSKAEFLFLTSSKFNFSSRLLRSIVHLLASFKQPKKGFRANKFNKQSRRLDLTIQVLKNAEKVQEK